MSSQHERVSGKNTPELKLLEFLLIQSERIKDKRRTFVQEFMQGTREGQEKVKGICYMTELRVSLSNKLEYGEDKGHSIQSLRQCMDLWPYGPSFNL